MQSINMLRFQNKSFSGLFSPNTSDERVLNSALEELKNVQLAPEDVDFVKTLGAKPPFSSGKEAYDYIHEKNLKIKFKELPSLNIHAQWDIDKNTIRINEMYRNTQDRAIILAIAEAIFHEVGHAKDEDGLSSIQEEIDCLSLNAMAHRDFKKKYNDVFANSDAPIVTNGVCLYSEIYFQNDPNRLIHRVKNTYGHLPVGDEKHSSKELAKIIKYRQF